MAQAHGDRLSAIDGLRIFGPSAEKRSGVVSFTLADIHPHDPATVLDGEGVCVRAGHHCNQLLMTRLGVAATTRASFYLYNTTDECDTLLAAIDKAKKVFKV